MKKSFSEFLINTVLRFIFLGYIVAFAGWWYVSPKGFTWEHPRFWSNNIIPIMIVLASMTCCFGTLRSHKYLLSSLLPSYLSATFAFIVAGVLLYPISMRTVFLIPLLCWLNRKLLQMSLSKIFRP